MADYALDSYMLRLEHANLNTEEEPYVWMLVWDDTVNSSLVYEGAFGLALDVINGQFTTLAGGTPLPGAEAQTLSDARFHALRALGHTGSTSDMLLQWAQALGATSDQLNDAVSQVLVAQAGGNATGSIPDDWVTVLTALGYSGSRPEMEHAFWAAGGEFI